MNTSPVITRFAPSPTGFLHIGGARTALFNWLYAKANQGKFLLRIEDTDLKRSTKEAIDAILDGMQWLGLDYDQIVYQTERQERHVAVVQELLAAGKAYHCYCSKDELAQMREQAEKEGKRMGYDRRWRDRDPSEAPKDITPVIRIKAPIDGETVIRDHVQGSVKVKNSELDDFILLRADKTPTYMLAVVVDDHDMGVTRIIRGDDHLNNAFRQKIIFDAMGWDMPDQTHIPLIHGSDGAKLSKRHGALGVGAYRDMGILPEAMCNYLLRLGWSHGNDEIITREQAIAWFNLENLGKSPSRFDRKKLDHVNAHYLRTTPADQLAELIIPKIEQTYAISVNAKLQQRLIKAMPELIKRAADLNELAQSSLFLMLTSEQLQEKIPLSEKANKALEQEGHLLPQLSALLQQEDFSDRDDLEQLIRNFAEKADLKMGKVAGVVRVCLTRSHVSPSIFDMMVVLGKEETLARIHSCNHA